MLKRIGYFLLTNFLVMTTIMIVWTLVSRFLNINAASNYYFVIALSSLVFGMTGAFISLLLSKWMAKMMMGVEIIDPQTPNPELRGLVVMVHNFATKAGLTTMPEVGIYESPDLNAFATGPSRNNSMVAVSSGLLRGMSRDEVEGVLGHEVAHIANGDMVTMTLLQGIVNSFVLFFSKIIANVLASQVEEKNRTIVYFLANFVAYIAFTMLGMIVVGYFSRQREYRADMGGAKFAGRDKMVGGLRRLQANIANVLPDQSGLAALKISSPKGFMALFSTHPDLEDRVQRLLSTRGL